jgi:dienelactone hydrolase
MIGKLDQDGVVADARAVMAFLAKHEATNGKVGIVGFCWGGGVVGRVATAAPELAPASCSTGGCRRPRRWRTSRRRCC